MISVPKIVGEFLGRLCELRYVVDRWRMDYNHYRPHSSLNYMAPAAFGATCQSSDSATLHRKIEVEDDEEMLSCEVEQVSPFELVNMGGMNYHR